MPNQHGSTTGYLHADYAASLGEFGNPHYLPRCGGWVLKRHIPGFPDFDAMGCYPLFSCQDWGRLDTDLNDLGGDLVSLSVVTDPFGDYNPTYLRKCFPDVVIPFKEHYIVDLSCSPNSFVSAHHRRNVRKSLPKLQIDCCSDPRQLIGDWTELYDVLIKRHQIRGISAFSRAAFAKQLEIPGLVAFSARQQEDVVGMLLWYVQGKVGYYHLGAYSSTGYESGAAFALFSVALDYFSSYGLRWLNLGAGAGNSTSGADGLSRFKRGWSSGVRPAYLCGRIFDRHKYSEIVTASGLSDTNYFPAYRQGEFGG